MKQFQTGGPTNINITKILRPNDQKKNTPAFDEIKNKEIVWLISKDAFEVVLEKELPIDANTLGGRFVLTVKNMRTYRELSKSNSSCMDTRILRKNLLVHASRNMR